MLIKGDPPPPTHMVVQWHGPFTATLWREGEQQTRRVEPGETVQLPIELADRLLAQNPVWWKPADLG